MKGNEVNKVMVNIASFRKDRPTTFNFYLLILASNLKSKKRHNNKLLVQLLAIYPLTVYFHVYFPPIPVLK